MRKEVGYREKMASSFLHLSKSSMWLPASTICSYYTLIRCRIRKCTWVKTPEQDLLSDVEKKLQGKACRWMPMMSRQLSYKPLLCCQAWYRYGVVYVEYPSWKRL
ncbi:hypothetical protein Y1Q_0004371 [Alligator mississippiensis]|uniref:Uncharacterized protein n=1 Tax=Alligator mississippiensis TaxID=8496 RepID=A0A151MIQ6_ALLMI|nr:hypothetical protein Y1Q_0004371 [Alligator mississippiensis]